MHMPMAWQIAMTYSGNNIIIINDTLVLFTLVSIVSLLENLTSNQILENLFKGTWVA